MPHERGDDRRPMRRTALVTRLLSESPSETPEEKQWREKRAVEIIQEEGGRRSQTFDTFASIMVKGAWPAVRAQVGKKVRNREDADELTNKILFKAFEYLYKEGIVRGRFNPEMGSLLDYYLGACRRQAKWVIVDWIRSQVAANRLITELLQQDLSSTVEQSKFSSELTPEQACLDDEAIEELIEKFPEDKRNLVKSIAYGDMSRDDLAEQEGTTKRGIEGRVKRLRGNIQRPDQAPEGDPNE